VKSLLLHPGTQYSHRLAYQLNRVGCLHTFITGIAFAADASLLKWMPGFLTSKIDNRILDGSIKRAQLKTIPLPELVALFRLFRGGDMEEVLHQRNLTFQNKVPQYLLEKADNVVGFDTSSWVMEERVKKLNKPFFLDQSIAHPREKERIYEQLRTRYPDWSEHIRPKNESGIQVEEMEYSLATKVVVASTFTKNSLICHNVPAAKIIVNPYGVGKDFFRRKSKDSGDGKTRFLYLGLLGARKGLPFLLETWKETELHQEAELWIAGPTSALALTAIRNVLGVSYKGRVPYRDIPNLLDECDCLVFPSFFEGFGQVILEAMAAGLPVITTEATAGPDIIESGRDGFIIRSGDRKHLSEIMKQVANDRALCYKMGKLAVEKAKSFSWDAYGDRWRKIIASELGV
jgi:alpha-maltose-1-phosphate synthase